MDGRRPASRGCTEPGLQASSSAALALTCRSTVMTRSCSGPVPPARARGPGRRRHARGPRRPGTGAPRRSRRSDAALRHVRPCTRAPSEDPVLAGRSWCPESLIRRQIEAAPQKVMGHQGAGSHAMAVDSAAREPGVASVIRPALAMALSPVPPRYAAPTAQTGSTTSAGAVVRSQVARKPAGAALASAASLQRPAFCGHSWSATSMTTSTGLA